MLWWTGQLLGWAALGFFGALAVLYVSTPAQCAVWGPISLCYGYFAP